MKFYTLFIELGKKKLFPYKSEQFFEMRRKNNWNLVFFVNVVYYSLSRQQNLSEYSIDRGKLCFKYLLINVFIAVKFTSTDERFSVAISSNCSIFIKFLASFWTINFFDCFHFTSFWKMWHTVKVNRNQVLVFNWSRVIKCIVWVLQVINFSMVNKI